MHKSSPKSSSSASDVVGDALDDIETFVYALLQVTAPKATILDFSRRITEEESAKRQDLIHYFISKHQENPQEILDDVEIAGLLHTVNSKLSQVEMLTQSHQIGPPTIKRASELRHGLDFLSHLKNQSRQNRRTIPNQQQIPPQTPPHTSKQRLENQYSTRLQQKQIPKQEIQKRQPMQNTQVAQENTTHNGTNDDTSKHTNHTEDPPSSLVPPTPSPAPNFAFGTSSTQKPSPSTSPSPNSRVTTQQTKISLQHRIVHSPPPVITTHTSRPSYASPKSAPTSSNNSPRLSPPLSPSDVTSSSFPKSPSFPPASPTAQELAIQNHELVLALSSCQENVRTLLDDKDQSQQIILRLTQQINDIQLQYQNQKVDDTSTQETIAALRQQCKSLQADLDAHAAQAQVDHHELLRTIHLLESMNAELEQHNVLWRSTAHALVAQDPTAPFPEFSHEPIPDIAAFVDAGILAHVFQLRGALHEAEETNKVNAAIMKMEIEDLRKKTIVEKNATRSDADAQDTLHKECSSIATNIASLQTEHNSLLAELRAMRNDEPRTFDLLNASLVETKRMCEEKMRKYEEDMNALLASWTQQQTQLDAWVQTITAQQHELQSTQTQLEECKVAAQKAEATRRAEKEAWEKEEKQLRVQLSALRGETSSFRTHEEHASEISKLREKIGKQNKAITVLNAEMVATKEALKREKEAKEGLEALLSTSHHEGGLLTDELSRTRTQINDLELRVLSRLIPVGETAANAVEFIEQMREDNAQQRRELERLRHAHAHVLQQFHALREGWIDFLRELGVTVPALPSFLLPSPATFPLQQSSIPHSPPPQPPPSLLGPEKPPPSSTPSLTPLTRSSSATRYANIEDGERGLFIDSPSPSRFPHDSPSPSRFSSHIPPQIPRSTHSPTYKHLEMTNPPFPSSSHPSSSSNDILASLQDIEDKLSQIKMESKHDLSPSPSSISLYPPLPPSSSSLYPRPPSPTHSAVPYSSLSFTFDDEPSLFATPRPRLSKSQDAAPRKKEISSHFDTATHARVAKSGQTTNMLLDEVEQMEKMMKRWSSLDLDDFEREERGERGEIDWEKEMEEKKEKWKEEGERNRKAKRRSSLSTIGELEEWGKRNGSSKGRRESSRDLKDTWQEKKSKSHGKHEYSSMRMKGREKDNTNKYKHKEREKDREKDRDYQVGTRDEHVSERDYQQERSREKAREKEWERERLREMEERERELERYEQRQREEEIRRAQEKSYMRAESAERAESEINNEEAYESDTTESYFSSDNLHNKYFAPPPLPRTKLQEPGLAKKTKKKKKREVEEEDELYHHHQHLSPRSILPHLLNEIKSHALRNSAERVDAIETAEANRRNSMRLSGSRQSDLMEQIKALKPNSGARLAAIQDAEVHRTEEQEAQRKEFLDSFARRKQLLRRTSGGLAQIEEMRRRRDEEVRMSIAQELHVRTTLAKTPSLKQDLAQTTQASANNAGDAGAHDASAEHLLLSEDEDGVLEDGEKLLEGEGMLELEDEEIAALEREVAS